jgi:hypothetical protein
MLASESARDKQRPAEAGGRFSDPLRLPYRPRLVRRGNGSRAIEHDFQIAVRRTRLDLDHA